jgi:hypothetical protein
VGAVVQGTAGTSGTQAFLPKSDLRAGDVLLSCGCEALSELIRRLDGGLYSHAAVWDGEFAVDATERGVVRNQLEKDEAEQWYMDAYRWHAAHPNDDPDLGSAEYPSKPVLDESDKIVRQGTAFAYDELVLAALVIWLSNQPADRWLRAAARLLLSRFEAWLLEKIRKPGKTAMVCSETVARSFDQAKQPPDYTIQVIVDGSRDAAAIAAAVKAERAILAGVRPTLPAPASSYDALKRRYGQLLVRSKTEDERERLLEFAEANLVSGAKAVRLMDAGHRGIPPSCVTPRDLQRSPNLRKLGRLSENASPSLPKSTFGLFLLLLKEYLGFKVKRAFKR